VQPLKEESLKEEKTVDLEFKLNSVTCILPALNSVCGL